MSDEEKKYHLEMIRAAMGLVQQISEAISGHVLALEDAGMQIPAMRQTATTLAGIALGWGA